MSVVSAVAVSSREACDGGSQRLFRIKETATVRHTSHVRKCGRKLEQGESPRTLRLVGVRALKCLRIDERYCYHVTTLG